MIHLFTGIIEEISTVLHVRNAGESMQLTISANNVLSDAQLGDSIAVNGTCLTVSKFASSQFTVDVMPETFRATTLRNVKFGTRVNLERAMRADGRFGGHFVTGHVDGTAVVQQCRHFENSLVMHISLPTGGSSYVIPKGSIALEGTSLTIFEVDGDSISISLIPHTQKATVLAERKPGDLVNVEFDLLAKYTEKMMKTTSTTVTRGVNTSLLEQHGFL